MAKEYSPEVKAAVMADEQNIAYVYGLRSKDEQRYFYVGSTKLVPGDRLKAHLYSVKHGSHLNRHFANKVRCVGSENIVCDILQETDVLNRWQIEKAWIDSLLADGANLVNRIHNDIQYPIGGPGIKSTTAQWERILEFMDVPVIIFSEPRRQKIIDLLHELLRARIAACAAIDEFLVEHHPEYAQSLGIGAHDQAT